MDQLSAHLDRGWDLAQKGDAPGASACARRALEIDPQSPEVHNLLGFTAALRGEADEALEHYKQAITLDDTYFEAMLNAAEVLMYPLGAWEEAAAMCEDAYDLAETDEEIADCVLLKVDALMAQGDLDEARKAMAMIPEGPFESSTYIFLVGRAYYELGDFEKAAPLIEEAAKQDAAHADAHYYLGLVRDERGDAPGATEAFLRTRGLDLGRPAATWAPSEVAFAELVRAVIGKLDVVLARYIREANVYVVDVPGAELVVDGVDPRAMVIVDARPPDEPDSAVSPTLDAQASSGRLQARLFIYQRNVERGAGSIAALESELSAALEREITAVFLDREPVVASEKHSLN